MLEIGRSYSKTEMTQILATKSKQGIDRKLSRYGVEFDGCGRGENAIYTIKKMADPFKVFAITELDCDGNTDFTKLRNFIYHFFEDEIFMTMPDEVKEARMREMGEAVSRQTIANYTYKLESHDLISRQTKNFLYYFAFMRELVRTASANGTQRKFTRRMVMTSLWCNGFYSTALPQLHSAILVLSLRESKRRF